MERINKGRKSKGRKSEVLMEDFLRIILWIIFFILALLGVYYIINKAGF